MREICELCGSGKKLTVQEWNECPVQLADWKAGTYYPFFPRFLTYWWYFRKNPQHLKNKPMREFLERDEVKKRLKELMAREAEV